ncbi:hypothetical protein J2751_000530 [Halorubrum alkaliphilum]|uniref:Uncharacterized protein n=1 Tax=Halorubrum alkaliphilum TaxID=261290 RepID=A0A8T4GCL3_9EURY|nr:hypothetical protein [Halorubrum alkaliphilum]MBP1921537.1 hypothetical protein [Halorubrum alkaliphilum]
MTDEGEDGPSVAARDDLAGVVDLFGSLTRAELSRALSELAFKQRTEIDEDAIAAAIDLAVAEYAIVPAPEAAVSAADSAGGGDCADGAGGGDCADGAGGGDCADGAGDDPDAEPTFLAVGPAAFPSLPAGAEDLPHILDVPDRAVDREALSSAVLDRLSDDAVAAIESGDADRLAVLADVTYDIEAWAPVDAGPIRERIVAELDE